MQNKHGSSIAQHEQMEILWELGESNAKLFAVAEKYSG